MHSSKRVLFFGWGAAAASALRTKALKNCIVRVITHLNQPDDCHLGDIARELGFECFLTDVVDPPEVMSFHPDLIVSVSYRQRIPQRVLDLADAINFHPSLLPKHRGCFSGFHVIFDGDAKTGVTCHRMLFDFDKGHILHEVAISVTPDATSASLYKDLLQPTADCFEVVLAGWVSTGVLPKGRPQEGEASYHFRKLPYGGTIQPQWDSDKVERFIRAMHFPPHDGALLVIDGKRHVVDTFQEYQRLVTASPVTSSTDDQMDASDS
eukprot:GEMP01062526.1.p1 GENE.GEMP01062526.1~~GEMP01062526.1.p1  ORF type:complete len:266 (+),score=38.26 GEMP01062526.1:56-853(+)